MPFSPETRIQALVACGRCCCICHKFCGIKIECHHIVQEANSGPNSFENCIPLCFDCHADMLAYDDAHPKGTKYRPEELKAHRDKWIEKVSSAHSSNYNEEHRKLDQHLYRRILAILPWNGSIRFLSQNNFAGYSFQLSNLDDTDKFYFICCDNPEWEFIDPTLEALRATLCEKIRKFNSLIATNTFPTQQHDRNTVPPEWEIEEPERFDQVVDEIHASAQNCVDSYKSLIREGRRLLAVEAQEG